MQRPGMILLALALLVGTVAAFTYTESLKVAEKPLGKVRLDRWVSPECDCQHQTARLSLDLREPEQIDVTVVDDDGDAVRRLASGLRRPAGRVALTWDGRDDAGRVAADGAYHYRVRLVEERRTIAVPLSVTVDTRAPRVRLLSVTPTVVPLGSGLEARYRADEVASPVLFVDGREVQQGKRRQPGAHTLAWPGLVDGLPLPTGVHTVALAAADRAGNVSAPTEEVTIVVIPASAAR